MDFEYSVETAQLLEYDKQYMWHPYTSLKDPLPVLPVKDANGCEIVCDTKTTTRVIDAMSSWWCVIHGYNNERLNNAILQQVNQFSHVLFGGFTHKPAVNLVKKLIQLIDEPQLKYCFLADSGSVAVEVALKFAFQANLLSSEQKHKFLTIKKGYHGDTFGAMSVCDPVSSMHNIYGNYLPTNIFIDEPPVIELLPYSQHSFENNWDPNCIKNLEEAFKLHYNELCAVILEPLLQGAGGMRLYHPQYLIELKKMCLKYNVLLIFDEIATGFGRTGEIFAFKHCYTYQDYLGIPLEDQIEVVPDILCVGKALTGGYMTLSAVVVNDRVVARITDPLSPTHGYFMHGPTFMGNALACSVANASLDILLEGTWKKQVFHIEYVFYNKLYQYIKNPENKLMYTIVKRVSIVGAVAVVELFHNINTSKFQSWIVSKGVHIRPVRSLIYIMPPYIIKDIELEVIIECIIEFLHLLQAGNGTFYVKE
ncbi:adenosylmethionine-8-amino-7-oxononanoate transaminase PWA37_000544 [Arxiozyma heterogenica]|uniref:7,8-diamino-pelargonic acid aminotransferase n=1 Tax=Arxiozyma heterogenica TaxID=278026 RepID=A0AAN8A7M8_9SACH|nr:hypothetical protein RI543_003874 [Kazachstania heterogenica]